MIIDDVKVILENGPFTAEDAQYYIDRIKSHSKFTLKKVVFRRMGSQLDIRCSYEDIPFERIRRINLGPQERPKQAVNN